MDWGVPIHVFSVVMVKPLYRPPVQLRNPINIFISLAYQRLVCFVIISERGRFEIVLLFSQNIGLPIHINCLFGIIYLPSANLVQSVLRVIVLISRVDSPTCHKGPLCFHICLIYVRNSFRRIDLEGGAFHWPCTLDSKFKISISWKILDKFGIPYLP